MYERRLRGLLIAYWLLLGVLGARAFALQVTDSGAHRERFEKGWRHTYAILPRRGEIHFSDGTPMAWNEPGFRLEVAFRELDDRVLPTAAELRSGFAAQVPLDAQADSARLAAARSDRERTQVRRSISAFRGRQRLRREGLARDLPKLRDRYLIKGLGVRWECAACGRVTKSTQPPDDPCRDCGRDDAFALCDALDLQDLAALLATDTVTLQAAFAGALRRWKERPEYRLHPLLLRIPARAAEAIALMPRRFAGIEARPRRARGYDPIAETIAGSVRLPYAEDLERLTDPDREARGEHVYTATEVYQSLIGATGLEARFDDVLRGVPGRGHRVLERRGKLTDESVEDAPVRDGATLHTTIRRGLQELAVELVERAPANGHGAAVVMDVRDGAVLAIASTDRDAMDHARSNVRPGSVFKLVTAVAWLESGHAANETLECEGRRSFPGRGKYTCAHTDGDIALVDAFTRSCNGFFAQAAIASGGEGLVRAYERLGLARRHDIGLDMGRTSRAGLEAARPGHPDAGRTWNPWDLAFIGIGQGKASASPLQVVTAYARVAAGGRLVRPFLLERDRPAPGTMATDPVLARCAPLIREGARRVVHDPHGTAYRRPALRAVRAAGKTGTGEVPYDRRLDPPMDPTPRFLNNAWFVGYAPHDAPRYAAVVVFERTATGRYGATEAGDPVAELLAEALREQ